MQYPSRRNDQVPPPPEVDTTPKADDQMIGETKSDNITDLGSITTNNGENTIQCLTIVGQIEGHYNLPPQNKTTKYEHIIPTIVAIEESTEIDGLLIILNTVGGDVEAGLALSELISGMKKPTVSLVLGGGHSIGIPLAVSAKRSFIVPSATMTIHPVRVSGTVLGVPQTYYYFQKMQERIINFIISNSRMSRERFQQYMMNTNELVLDIGSVLDGPTAVQEGLIDELGSLSDAICCLHNMVSENKQKNKDSEDTNQSNNDNQDKA